jgi:hypothetical protein
MFLDIGPVCIRVYHYFSISVFNVSLQHPELNMLCLTFCGASVLKMMMVKSDSREEIMHEDAGLASNFIKTLFGVLYEVYSSSVSFYACHMHAPSNRIDSSLFSQKSELCCSVGVNPGISCC